MAWQERVLELERKPVRYFRVLLTFSIAFAASRPMADSDTVDDHLWTSPPLIAWAARLYPNPDNNQTDTISSSVAASPSRSRLKPGQV